MLSPGGMEAQTIQPRKAWDVNTTVTYRIQSLPTVKSLAEKKLQDRAHIPSPPQRLERLLYKSAVRNEYGRNMSRMDR